MCALKYPKMHHTQHVTRKINMAATPESKVKLKIKAILKEAPALSHPAKITGSGSRLDKAGWSLEPSGTAQINSQVATEHSEKAFGVKKISGLKEVPASWWVDPGPEVADDCGGYQYMTLGNIGSAQVEILVDGVWKNSLE
jgi:hypothetical protein